MSKLFLEADDGAKAVIDVLAEKLQAPCPSPEMCLVKLFREQFVYSEENKVSSPSEGDG